MKTTRALIFTLAAFAPAAPAFAGSGPTAICNPVPYFSSSITLRYGVAKTDPRIQEMLATASNPNWNPPLYERMGKPIGVTEVESNGWLMILDYPLIQDPMEMAERFRADAEIAAPFGAIGGNGVACTGVPTDAPTKSIVEYYNSSLNHYYMSSNPDEMAWLDGGGGGGGWLRTGEWWTTHVDAAPNCYVPRYNPVYLFYGTPGVGPNSHYYSSSPEECGWLRTSNPAWTYLTVPFGAMRPGENGCPIEAPVALMLVYNNRAAQNDSNHRYTSNHDIYQAMLAQGWIGYGQALCVKSTGAP